MASKSDGTLSKGARKDPELYVGASLPSCELVGAATTGLLACGELGDVNWIEEKLTCLFI